MEDIVISTPSGYSLPACLYESNAGLPGAGPLVLISSATAVPRRYYRHFAQYLADNGARAVMTYDYRGINGELRHLDNYRVRMSDWAVIDMPAVISYLRALFPDHELAGFGHSFGGQALGLTGRHGDFERYMTLCSGSGYLGHTREPEKLWRGMNLIGLPLALSLGKLPRAAGMGEPLPFGAFNQWRRWCNSPDYFMSDETVPERDRFADVTTTMAFVGFEDDDWATRESTEAMMRWYARANGQLRWFDRNETGGSVGHFGFFRPDHRETLWPQIADWLIRN